MNRDLQQPAVVTLNRMGYMFNDISDYGRAFVEYAKSAEHPVLDVAAAYGVATHKALAEGATVYANDLDPQHLEILKTNTPPEHVSRLHLVPGRFPRDLSFPENFFEGILLSHVLHFLRGEEIERGVEQVFKWLRPQGKVFVIVGTPYVSHVKPFIPVYEQRKKQGDPWPGFIVLEEYGPHPVFKNLPPFMNFVDEDILQRVFEEQGFVVERTSIFGRPDFPQEMQMDGRENVGLIARKP